MRSSVFVKSLGELHAAESTAELIHWALNTFSQRLGTECAIWTQYDRQNALSGATLGEQTDPGIWRYGPIIQEHLLEHPIFHMLKRSGEAPVACKTTDFAAQRVLDEMPLFREAYRHMASRYQLALVLESPTVPRCTLSFGRNGSDYGVSQVRVLQESGKHFLTALSKLRRIEEMEQVLAGPGVLQFRMLKTAGAWYFSFTDDVTLDGLSRCFGRSAEKFLVPTSLAVHLEGMRDAPRVIMGQDGSRWTVAARLGNRGEVQVRMEPDVGVRLVAAFPSLTPRECDVAVWLCEGKSNPEIGVILNISPKTVEKHLEGLFRKLGVESRLAALQHLMRVARL